MSNSNLNLTATRMRARPKERGERLVLFPIGNDTDDEGVRADAITTPDAQNAPLGGGFKETDAERVGREERSDLPRATAYALADSLAKDELLRTLRISHKVAPETYDECVYARYGIVQKQTLFGEPSSVAAVNPKILANQTKEVGAQSPAAVRPPWTTLGEVFLFEYGVIVLWNFTPYEERRYIDSLKKILQNGVGEGNEEIEDFHFQYDLSGPSQPRIFEDLITLRSGNPLIKLTISSGLAQSVKLAIFEKIMEETIEDTRPLPKMMAEVGDVKLPRTDVMRTIGHLFKLRMDVNLVSNVLDTPELFWSVPELEGLYNAVRAYLEISQRVSILNNRMEVLSDLLEVLSDHMNSNQMNVITWIIIVLICFAVVIAVLEVWVKMLRLEAGLDF